MNNQELKIRLYETSYWKRTLPFSQFSPVKPEVQIQRYILLVYPVKHVPLLRQGLMAQGF